MNTILEFINKLLLGHGIVIAVACFIVGQIVKYWIPEGVLQNKFIPTICGVLGIILGILLGITGYMNENNLILCAIDGLALGWAATGGVETLKGVKTIHQKEE